MPKPKNKKPSQKPSTPAGSSSVAIPTPVPTVVPASSSRGRILRQEVEMHSGPFPSPKTLAEYDKVVPHLAENVVLWVENEQKHRHLMEHEFLEIEKAQSRASIRDGRVGLVFGFILTLAGFATAAWFAVLGHPWAGAAVFGGTLLGIVWCFIFGSKVRAQDSLQQMQQVMATAGENGKPDPAQHTELEEQKSVSE